MNNITNIIEILKKCVVVLTLLPSCFLYAAQEPFVFGIDKGSGLVGQFYVKSCKVTLPSLGSLTEGIVEELIRKGYQPVVNKRIFGKTEVGSVQVKKLWLDYSPSSELSGTMYLESEVATGFSANKTKLKLKVFGDDDIGTLFESYGYDSAFLPGHADLYEVTDLPNCISLK